MIYLNIQGHMSIDRNETDKILLFIKILEFIGILE